MPNKKGGDKGFNDMKAFLMRREAAKEEEAIEESDEEKPKGSLKRPASVLKKKKGLVQRS